MPSPVRIPCHDPTSISEEMTGGVQLSAIAPDTRALPVSILCGDPKFPPIQHAGAVPPRSVSVPAQEHFGFHALRVVPVSECVFAGC